MYKNRHFRFFPPSNLYYNPTKEGKRKRSGAWSRQKMGGIEELRAKAIASMGASSSSTPLNPNPNPPPASQSLQSNEDGEISSPPLSDGMAKDILACHVSTPANSTLIEHSPISLTNKQHENPKRGSILGPNPLSKLVAAQSKMSAKKDYNMQMKQIPFKSRTLTWHATSSSDDNLVIRFSDDDSESEPDDSKAEEKYQRKDQMVIAERFKRPMTTSGQPTEVLQRASNDKTKMTLNSSNTSHQSALSIRKVQGTNPKGSGAALLANEVQLQKQDPATKVFAQQDQQHIEDVSGDNKQGHSCQESQAQETDSNHQKIVNQRKRRISGINGNVCDSEGLTLHKHLKSTSDGNEKKPLKADEQSHMKSKNTPDDHVKLPFSLPKSVSEVKMKTFGNSGCHQGNVMSHQHCSKQGSVGRTDSRSDIWHSENNKTMRSSSTVLYGAKDIETSMPFKGGVAHTTQDVKFPSIQGNQGTSGAGISSDDDVLVQKVTQACPSAGFNQSSQFQKMTSHAEDTATRKIPSPDNLQVDMDIESLLKLEELLDKELERAQELRHNCELEERDALKAYRKAQRDLMDANSKCFHLYGKRECISAKLRAFMMEASNSLWTAGWSSKGETVSDLLKDLAGAENDLLLNLSSQMTSKGHNLEMIGFGSNVGATDADICHSSYQHVGRHALMSEPYPEPVVQTSHSKFVNSRNGAFTTHRHNMPADADQQDYLLYGISNQSRFKCEGTRENMVTVDAELERGCEDIQDYELEASLRSKLVARLGVKGFPVSSNRNTEAAYATSKVDFTATDKTKTIDMHNQMQYSFSNPLLLEEGTNQSSVHGQLPGNVVSLYGESHLNTSPHERSITQVSICSLRCSVLRIVSKHAKFILPESNISSERALNVNCYDSMLGAAGDNITEYKSILSKLMNVDSYTSYLVIDPFWPFCMFELRGKCNNEECPWQHLRQQSHRNGKHVGYTTFGSDGQFDNLSSFGKCSDDPKSSHGYLDILPIPAYWIGSNLVRAETQSSGSLLARSNWQYRQMSFCTSFCLPFPIERLLPPDAPILHDWGCHADDDDNSKMLSLYLLSQDGTGRHISHGSTEPEQSLELAIDLFNMKENKSLGRKKSLFVLSRSLEANPKSVVLWVVYLHIYYRKEKDVGKDDMFHHAVRHNEGSYELWLMYINSRMQLDHRINAYTDAISALSRKECSDNTDGDRNSSCILDLFLQMIDLLCMSGKVENAISRIHGLLNASTDESSESCLISKIFRYLIVSDRCIFCICCIYVTLYRKLPEVVIQQHELVKDLPFGIEWPFIQLTSSEKHLAVELMKLALDTVDMDAEVLSIGKECFQGTVLRSAHFLAVSHVKFSVAVEGFDSTTDLLVKYLSKYPTCIELVMLSAHYRKLLKNESTFEMFEQALHNWPKQAPGIQCLWNQYAEYVLECKCFDVANELMVRWFHLFCKVEESQIEGSKDSLSSSVELPSLSLDKDGFHPNQEDITFGLLNLFLYIVLQKDRVKAQLAINEALKHAAPGCFKHCVREHAAFLLPNGIVSTHNGGSLGLLSSYIGDVRSSAFVQPLTREIFSNIKKPRVRHLINNFLSPVSRDCSLLNSFLEDCYGPLLLPEEFDESKDLVDCAEYLMEISPANHKLAISVHEVASRNFGQSGISSASILFWASSLLVNSIFQALPVAPEQAWVEAARVLSVLEVPDISERFHRQGLLVYPFSVKLWESYYNLSKITGNASLVVESAREKGIDLG